MVTPDPMSTRPINERLRVELFDGFLEFLNDHGEGLGIHYAELPALIAVLQDLSVNMVGNS